jgi:hypothetical protein
MKASTRPGERAVDKHHVGEPQLNMPWRPGFPLATTIRVGFSGDEMNRSRGSVRSGIFTAVQVTAAAADNVRTDFL